MNKPKPHGQGDSSQSYECWLLGLYEQNNFDLGQNWFTQAKVDILGNPSKNDTVVNSWLEKENKAWI